MSTDFDDFIAVVHKLRNEVEDGRPLSIADRRVIEKVLRCVERQIQHEEHRGE